ncbi:hypothetical protein TraAM80_01964 [Trypanosoma rangeli]|uniref:Uncharacterized protein n=1 Tax=Trypanosoma rangeli TaxID=5698 RepID=A0A3R7NQB0_TRYRA|nr:uncharacterized protein TraAM80_01964 [Trypanosoma rangeli]RNF09912.1 hypothetical protein TraAM80_01964 [Trypanosoma rangeli]|eukprot:RNF09912.1 hypothetical protein TraAM80_01964 [Trypanosoma rangeli]
MRSNGAGHLGNDTFMAVTRDDTDNMFLVTSKLVEERVTLYPLARRVSFTPRSDTAPAMDVDKASSAPSCIHAAESGEATPDAALDGPHHDVRHSFHPSVDGKLVAVISTGRWKHYMIDVLSARVCEFRTLAPVMGVAWHPISTQRLMLLLATGTLLLLRADTAVLGVAFEERQEVPLREIIAEYKDYVLNGDDVVAMDQLENLRGRKRETSASKLSYKSLEQEALARIKQAEKSPPAAALTVSLSSPSFKSTRSAAHASDISLEESKGDETTEEEREEDEEEEGTGVRRVGTDHKTEFAVPAELDSTRNEMNSSSLPIGMCIIPASLSLPVMLLVLNRGGDIFSIKIDQNGLPTTLVKEYDGCVETLVDGKLRQQGDAGLAPCVHYLLCGGPSGAGYVEEPLAIGSTLLDEDVGRHVVFVMYSSGVLRGGWFTEPDLLCRDLMRRQMDFAIHLDAAFLPAPPLPCALTMVYLVGLYTCGNATLIRYNDAAYLCVWPTWSRKAGGWIFRNVGEDGCQRVPLVSQGPVVPEPVALRLPYDVYGASIAVGVNDILIFPEVIGAVSLEEQSCPRSKVVTVKIANLVLAALYASNKKYSLTFDNDISDASEGENAPAEETRPRCLERLLELTAESYKRWLCSYPREDKDNATMDLAKGVQAAHEELIARQNTIHKREGDLSARVQRLLQRQQELSQSVVHSQSIIRDAVVHRGGVDVFYAANEALGKAHRLLNELEALAAKQSDAKRREEASPLA